MTRSLGLDKVVLPHQLLDEALEEMIQYVEAVHEISLNDAKKDKLRSLLVAAQEVVRERRGGYRLVAEPVEVAQPRESPSM